MRIVGGRLRGRPIKAPAGRDTRPTADRVREALFNILEHGIEDFDLDGASVLDVFAGTGAFGLEALSRGAAHATFLDADPAALKCIRENAATLGEIRNAAILKLDATRPPPPPRVAEAPCGLVFLDPPYGQDLAPASLRDLTARGWVAAGAVCIAETGAKEDFTPPRGFETIDVRAYGAAQVVILRNG